MDGAEGLIKNLPTDESSLQSERNEPSCLIKTSLIQNFILPKPYMIMVIINSLLVLSM